MLAIRPFTIHIRKPKQDPAFIFQSVFTRKINELAKRSAEMLHEEIKSQILKKINATGELHDSVTVTVSDNRSGQLIRASSDMVQAHTSEKGATSHGAFSGRGPSGANKSSIFLSNIMVWMDAKNIDGGKPAAFRIARAIALKGLPSSPKYPLRHPFTNAQRVVRRKIHNMWAVELDAAIARLNRNA